MIKTVKEFIRSYRMMMHIYMAGYSEIPEYKERLNILNDEIKIFFTPFVVKIFSIELYPVQRC